MTTENGIVTLPSNHPVNETIDRAESLIKSAGNTIFARIDHQAGAVAVGLTMPPMQLIIFGNPRAGTALMLAAPTFGIDLPLKLLAWQDAAGRVWLSYDSPVWLGKRHGNVAPADKLEALEVNLHKLAEKVTQ